MAASPRQRVTVELIAVEGLPEIQPGDDLAGRVTAAAMIQAGDVVVIAQKVVSKQEGRRIDLRTVQPSPHATRLGRELDRDPRFIQLVLDEAVRVVRTDRVLIVETRHGFVCANAGVDASNAGAAHCVTLLPLDCDASAASLRSRIVALSGVDVAVIVSDTFGRPWRLGICNVALGIAGAPALVDRRGDLDDDGRPLHATVVAVADEIAAAAELVMGKTSRVPAVLVRGLSLGGSAPGVGHDLVRPPQEDLFR